MIDEVAIRLAPRAPNETDLQKTLLYAYHHIEHYDDAERVFRDIEALRAKNKVSDSDWYEARLEAAHVAVDAGKDKEATQLYESLKKDAAGDLSLRNEYAGVLVRFGHFDAAEEVYKGVNPDMTARKLIFDINLQKMAQYPESEDKMIADSLTRDARVAKRRAAFDEAMKQLTAMRISGDLKGEQRLETDKMEANLYASTKNFEEAKKVLDKIRLNYPDETGVVVKIAQMELGMKKFDEALQTIELILKEDKYSADGIRAFIDAASAVKTRDPAKNEMSTDGPLEPLEQQIATTIYNKHRDKIENDPLYLTRLSWVLIRCKNVPDSEKALTEAYGAFQKKGGDQDPELRKEIAMLMIRHGQFSRAAGVLAGTNTIEARKLSNDLLLQDKNFNEALSDARAMERIFTSKEEKLDIQKRIANIYVAKGDFNEAMKAYENLKTQDKEAEMKIAQLYLYMATPPGKPGYDAKNYPGQLQKALAELEKAIAKEDFQKVPIEVRKNFIDAAAGVPEISPKQAAMVERIADDVLKTHGGDAEALSRLAWVLLKAEDKEKAVKVLDKALLLPVQNREIRKELSGVLAKAGKNEQAANLVKDLAQSDEDHLALAKLYSGGELWTEALQEVDAVLAKSPENKDAQVLHADIQSWKGDHAKAIVEFDALMAKYADDPKLPVRRAEVMLWKKDYVHALDEFLKLYESQPNNSQVWSGIAATIAAIAGPGDGKVPVCAVNAIEAIAQRVLTSATADPLLLSRTALVMSYLKDPIAGKLVDRAKASDPKDPIAKIELASALSAMKRYPEAVAVYKSLPILSAQNRVQLINIATAAEQLDLAAEQARLLVKEAENHKNDKILLKEYLARKRILAQVLSWRGDYAESMALYEDLIKVGFEQADIKLMMAEVAVWAHQYREGLIRFYDLVDTKLEQPRVWIGYINSASSVPTMTKDQLSNILFIADKVASEIKEPELLSRLAWVLIREKHAAKADPLLKRAVEMLKKDPAKDAAIRKEIAGVLVARLFPKQVIIPQPGQELVTRRWLIHEAIALYASLDPDTDFDQKTRIDFITLLLVSDEKDSLAKAEVLMRPLRLKTRPESYDLASVSARCFSIAKFDITKAKFKEAQEQFLKIIADLHDPNKPLYQTAEVRLAEVVSMGGRVRQGSADLQTCSRRDYVEPGQEPRHCPRCVARLHRCSIGDDWRQVQGR